MKISLMKRFSLIIVRFEVLKFARLRVWLLALLHWKFSLMLTDDSQRGHGVCEILNLVYAKGCYSLMKTFFLIIVREEVLEFARH